MKKNVVFLKGIVFLIALLVVGGCNQSTQKEANVANSDIDANSTLAIKDPEGIDIFLRAVQIDNFWHLEMYDSKKTDKCPAIDGLITEVNPKDTVYWKKATASKINEVTNILLLTDDNTLYGNEVEKVIDEKGDILWKLVVPDFETPDTIKYEVHFIPVGEKDPIIIDPYLKLPKQE